MQNTPNPATKKAPHLLVLMIISCVMSFAIVLVTPALPALSLYFSESKNSIKQIVTWFLLGFPIGVLFYAPFSNRFGRKNTLYLGFGIALFGTALCIITYFFKSFLLMNIGRFIQGFGSIASVQVAITIVGDCYKDKKARVISAMIMLSVGIAPGIGVAVGAFLMNFEWIACFYFYAAYFVFLLLVTKCFVCETILEKKLSTPKEVLAGYLENIKVIELLFCGLLIGTTVAITYIFPSISAFIVLKSLSDSENTFALWNFLPILGVALGNLLSMYFVRWFSPLVQLCFGVICLSVAALCYLIFFYFDLIVLSTLFFPYVVALMGLGFINSNTVAYTVKFSKSKANGSSVFSFYAYATSAVFMFVLSFINSKSMYLMPIFFVIISLLCWGFVLALKILKKKTEV